MRAFWLHVRNSPIRWALPVLIAVGLAVLFLRNRHWIGVWPETGAAAQVPAYFLGALGAGAAAWAAGSLTRQRLAEQIAAAQLRPSTVEAYRLGATVVILVTPYLLGQAVAFTITALTFPPGWHLWLGYLALGLFAMLLAIAWGWVLGKLLGSVFAALSAVLGWLLLVVVLEDFAGLTFMVVRASPEVAVAPAAITLRLGLVVALLVTLPWLPAAGQLRQQGKAVLGPLAATLALGVALVATTVVVDRDLPGDAVSCVDGTVQLCVWPEHQKYEPLLADLNHRIAALPDVFVTPARMNEFGIERTLFVDDDGVINLVEGEHVPFFYIIEGSPWSYAGQIATAIMEATWQGCGWEAVTTPDQGRLFALDAWLEAYLAGGGDPDYSMSASAELMRGRAAGRAIANEQPLAAQFSWARDEISDLRGHYCRTSD